MAKKKAENTHGEKKTFRTNIRFISSKPSESTANNGKNLGKYLIECDPVDPYNPTGRFMVTEKELSQFGNRYSCADFLTVVKAANKGGAKFQASATYCKAGQPYVDGSPGVYEISHWRVDDKLVILGEYGLDFLADIEVQTSILAETAGAKANKEAAHKLRLQAVTGNTTVEDEDEDL